MVTVVVTVVVSVVVTAVGRGGDQCPGPGLSEDGGDVDN